MDGRGDIFELHDSIDTVERELKSALGCDATIHMDPVETDNEQVNAEHAALEEALKDVEGLRGIHDFRMVMGPSHTNLIFDVVMDTGCGKTPAISSAALSRKSSPATSPSSPSIPPLFFSFLEAI